MQTCERQACTIFFTCHKLYKKGRDQTISISLCMIVTDEEALLCRCLDSRISAADEIVIVDTGSTDRTKEIAADYTDRIYDFKWEDDFSAARNFALSKGYKDYLMWLDADDVISEENLQKLKELKVTLTPEVDVVMMPYAAALVGKGPNGLLLWGACP